MKTSQRRKKNGKSVLDFEKIRSICERNAEQDEKREHGCVPAQKQWQTNVKRVLTLT